MARKFELADIFARPIAQVDASVGTVYLYSITTGDVTSQATEGMIPEDRARYFLPRISSLQKRESYKEEQQPLPDAAAAALTDDDIARIADALREAFPRSHIKGEGEEPEIAEEGRREGERSLAYLDRILQAELAYHSTTLRQVWERAQNLDGIVGRAFKELRGSSDHLAKTVQDAKLAFSPHRLTEIDTSPFQAMAEAEGRRRADRQEEREWSRLSLQMNTQSAQMLTQLVNTAGSMMVQWDERDKRTDKQINLQLWIAVAALVASTLLSGLATYYGYFTKVAYEREVAKEKQEEAVAKATSHRDNRIERLLEQNAALLQQNADLIERTQKNATPRRPSQAR